MSAGTLVLAAARWVELAGLLGFIGVLHIRNVNRFEPVLQWARPPMHAPLAIAAAGGVATVAVGGPELGVVLRAVAEVAALAFCLTIGRGAVPAAVLAIFLLPLSTHAVQVNPAPPAYLLDLLHVVTAGAWAGGIAVLAFLKPPDGWRGEEGRELLRRFGGVALAAFAGLAISGFIQAGEQLRGVPDLWTTAYGAVLLAKSVGVLAMLAMSALTWRRGVPLARAEAAVALLVVAGSAALVAFPTTPGQA